MKPVLSYVELPDGYKVLLDGASGRYSFQDPVGDVHGAHISLALAERAAERHFKKSQEKERKCLSCPRVFTSKGKGNRMCPECRMKAVY